MTNGMVFGLVAGLLGCNSPDPARDNGSQRIEPARDNRSQRIDATPMSSAETLAHLCDGKDVRITLSYDAGSTTGYTSTFTPNFTGQNTFERPVNFQWNSSSGYEVTTRYYDGNDSGTVVFRDKEGTFIDSITVKNDKGYTTKAYSFIDPGTIYNFRKIEVGECVSQLPLMPQNGGTCKELRNNMNEHLTSIYDSLALSIADKKAGKEQEGVHVKHFCEQ